MLGVLHGWGQGELFLCASQPHGEGEEEEEGRRRRGRALPTYWDAAMWGCASLADHRMRRNSNTQILLLLRQSLCPERRGGQSVAQTPHMEKLSRERCLLPS